MSFRERRLILSTLLLVILVLIFVYASPLLDSSSSSSSSIRSNNKQRRKTPVSNQQDNNEAIHAEAGRTQKKVIDFITSNFDIKELSALKNDHFETPFRPPAIEAQLEKLSQQQRQHEDSGNNNSNDNSVSVTQEEIDRAKDNWIFPMKDKSASSFILVNKICGRKQQEQEEGQQQHDNNNDEKKQKHCQPLERLWNSIRNYVSKRTNSNSPIVSFLMSGSCVLPSLYLRDHENATFLLVDNTNHHHFSSSHSSTSSSSSSSSSASAQSAAEFLTFSSKRVFVFSPPLSSSASSKNNNKEKKGKQNLNEEWMFGRDSPLQFGNFFLTCNFVAQTFIIDEKLLASFSSSSSSSSASSSSSSSLEDELNSEQETEARTRRLTSVFLSLPLSLHVFATLRPSEVLDIENSIDRKTSEVRHPPEGLKDLGAGTLQTLRISIDRLLLLCPEESEKAAETTVKDTSGCVFLVAIHVLESRRVCAKTWAAPLVQWGRKLVASRTASGEIRFQVEAVSQSAKGSGRLVHPLSYIPSVNLDTILGAGVSPITRIRLLADMVRTPRYSDPLPHNWVVGFGGAALRIDKIDKRYDRDVDETKGYWGVSTRGYLHLLGHHLCLRIHSLKGLPTVMTEEVVSTDCSRSCCLCSNTCSYAQKGTEPCNHCLHCASCLEQEALLVLVENNERRRISRIHDAEGAFFSMGKKNSPSKLESSFSCHKEYSSMDAARKVWKKWKKQDMKREQSQKQC